MKLYNGLEIVGFISFWHNFSIELLSSLEPNCQRIFIFGHGIYEFSILPAPEPLAEDTHCYLSPTPKVAVELGSNLQDSAGLLRPVCPEVG